MSGSDGCSYQHPPAGGGLVPGDTKKKRQGKKWLSRFIIDLDTYRNGWSVLEIMVISFTIVRGGLVMTLTNLILKEQIN